MSAGCVWQPDLFSCFCLKPTLFVQFEILLAPPVLLLQDFLFLPPLCRSLTSEGPPALGCWSLWALNTTQQQPLILIKKDWRTITQAKKTLMFGNSPQSSCCSPKITYTAHRLRPELILNLSYVKNPWWCEFHPHGSGLVSA